MGQIKHSPADELRGEVRKLAGSANIFVRQALGDLPVKLDAWVHSVEARLSRLEGGK